MSPSPYDDNKPAVNFQKEKIQEVGKGKKNESSEDKLMRSVLSNDKKKINEGKLLTDMVNHNFGFTPNLAFDTLVKNFSFAENLYGPTLIRRITGYDANYIKKNLRLPEFKRDLKKRIADRYDELKEDKLIDREGMITEEGYKLSSLIMYVEELDNLIAKGIGEKSHSKKEKNHERTGSRNYKKNDRYKDINLKMSIKKAVKRMHKKLEMNDLKVHKKKSKGKIDIVYCFDTSGSMKGKKLEMAKKAGIALMYNAISNKDKVGLLQFGTDIWEKVAPTDDFMFLLSKISKAKAAKETNITKAITDSIELFSAARSTKHLVLLTDAIPTVGKNPEKDTLDAVSIAADSGITISVIGINLDQKGQELAKKIAELGKGKLYIANDTEELDSIVLTDYHSL